MPKSEWKINKNIEKEKNVQFLKLKNHKRNRQKIKNLKKLQKTNQNAQRPKKITYKMTCLLCANILHNLQNHKKT